MQQIFVGLLLIILDFNIEAGVSTIGLIPSFLGYISLLLGLKRLSKEVDAYAKLCPLATGAVAFSVAGYMLDLTGISNTIRPLGILLGIIDSVLLLYILYVLVKGVQELEQKYRADLNSAQLSASWKATAAFQLISYAVGLVPALTVLSVIASIIACICYMVAFHTTKKQYQTLSLYR